MTQRCALCGSHGRQEKGKKGAEGAGGRAKNTRAIIHPARETQRQKDQEERQMLRCTPVPGISPSRIIQAFDWTLLLRRSVHCCNVSAADASGSAYRAPGLTSGCRRAREGTRTG